MYLVVSNDQYYPMSGLSDASGPYATEEEARSVYKDTINNSVYLYRLSVEDGIECLDYKYRNDA